MLKAKKFFGIYLILVILSSCSSFSSMKFWGDDDDIDPDEPVELKKISNLKDISLDWRISFTGDNSLGNFLPAFSAQSIFFADSDGNVKSIDSNSGKTKWHTKLNSLSSGVAAGFGALVVADSSGNVYLLDQDNGSVIWKINVKGEVLATAAIDTKFVVIKTGSGELLGLDKPSGEIMWSYRSKLPSLTIRGSSSPVIDNDQVYVSFDNGRLGVFELNSGFPIWDGAISYVKGSSELENLIDSDSNPVIQDGLVYTTNYQGKLNIFDIAQKRSVWSYDASSFFSPVITRGMIIVAESNSNLQSFSSKNLEESWSSEDYINRDISNPVSFKGNLIFGDLEGYLHVLDPLNGITIGRKKISKKPIKTIFSRSNSLYAVDEAFNLFSIKI